MEKRAKLNQRESCSLRRTTMSAKKLEAFSAAEVIRVTKYKTENKPGNLYLDILRCRRFFYDLQIFPLPTFRSFRT